MIIPALFHQPAVQAIYEDSKDYPVYAPFRVYTIAFECESVLRNMPRGVLQASESEDCSDDEDDDEEDSCPLFVDVGNMFPSVGNDNISTAWLPSELDAWSDHSSDEEAPKFPNVDLPIVESMFICIRQLFRARDFEDVGIAILQFLKAYTGRSACAMFSDVVQKAVSIFRSGNGTLQSGSDENIFTTLRKLAAKATAVTRHPLLIKFKRVMLYVVSFATMAKLGLSFDDHFYSAAEKEALSKEYSSTTGFLTSVFDSVTSLLERLVDCYQTGSWSPLLASSSSYLSWSDQYYDLKMKSQALHNPDACGFSYHEFLGQLADALEKGRAIVKYETDKSVAIGIRKMVADLELIKAHELTKRAARASRDAPFSILYYGGSSLAKTTLQDLTHSHFAKTHSLPEGDEYKYSRTSAEPYFSGFATQMWSIVVDDIANLNPNLGLDPSMAEILQIRNNNSYCPPQAELADKGRTPVLCQLLQASTNTKDLNAHSYYMNTLAIMRRWNYVVTVTLKKEFSQDENAEPHARMLDGAKTSDPEEGEYPDMWHFSVERVIASPQSTERKQCAAFAPVLETDSIYEYLAFISKASTTFREQQKKIRTTGSVYKQVTLCETCHRPEKKCICCLSQSGDEQSKELIAIAGMATATAAAAALPYLKRSIMSYALGKKAEAVDSVKALANEVAADVIANVVQDAKSKVIPHMVEFLRSEGVEVEGPVQYDAQVVDEELALRMELLRAPAVPQPEPECWYDIIQRKLEEIPGAARFQTEKRWVGAMLSRFGRKTKKGWKSVMRIPGMWEVYMTVVTTFGAIATVISVTKIVSYFTVKKKRGKSQGVEKNAGFVADEKPNPWYKEDFKPARGDFSPLTVSWKALSKEQLEQRVIRNVSYVKSEYVNLEGLRATRNFRMLCLGGQMYVTNAHSIPVETVVFNVRQDANDSGVSENYKVSLNPGDFYRDPRYDLIYFRIRRVPPKANLRGLLVSEKFEVMCNGFMVTRTPEGEEEFVSLRAITNSVENTPDTEGIVGYKASAERMTVAGECGSPYIGLPPMGPVLLGLHVLGGYTDAVACVSLTKESVERAIEALKIEDIHPSALRVPAKQSGDEELLVEDVVLQSEEMVVCDLHPKSTIRYIEEGTASVYGSIPVHRSGGKSKVTKTLIHDDLRSVGYSVQMGGPVLNHWKPWRTGAIDIVQQDSNINYQIVDACADAYFDDVVANVACEEIQEMRVLTVDEAVNGIPRVQYVDRMNLNSSMGFPWNSSKRNYLQDHGEYGDWQHFVTFDPEVLEMIADMRHKYSQGVRCNPFFRIHQKDEVVSVKKMADMKTRLFSGGNCPLGILMRQYFLPVVRLIQRNKFAFEAAPGTNATSLEWCEIFHWLTVWGEERMLAGDYSKFDKRMDPSIMLAAFGVLERLVALAGYSPEDMRTLRTMKWDVTFAVTEFNGDVIQWWGSNPSGHILTVIINCIANSIYIRYAWVLSGHDVRLFRWYVRLMTYGDDNVLSVSPECDNFNHCVVQEKLATIGVIYTMADKETESVPFIHMRDVSFLKRRWVYSSDVGSNLAQLEHESIAKSLLYHIPSQVVCVEKLAADAMLGALREYFAYGRAVFDDKREIFVQIVARHQLQYYFGGFPTYDQMVDEYLERGKESSPDGRCRKCAVSAA